MNQCVNVGVVLRRKSDEDFVQNFVDQVVTFWQKNYAFVLSEISTYDSSTSQYQFMPATILAPEEWGKVISSINCRKLNEEFFSDKNQSFEEFCKFIETSIQFSISYGLYCVCIGIDLMTDIITLAQIINKYSFGSNLNIWIKIYISRTEVSQWLSEGKNGQSLNIWNKWNELRLLIADSSYLGVCLELGDLQADQLNRLDNWFIEPLKCVILHSRVFKKQKNLNEFDIDLLVQKILFSAWKAKGTVALSNLNRQDDDLNEYYFSLNRLFNQRPISNSIEEFCSTADGMIQEPLQPLRDNLTSEIYNTFEMDQTKYTLYGQAISLAIQALTKISSEKIKAQTDCIGDKEDIEMECDSNPFVIAVLGAGRGPLVTKVFEVSEQLDVNIEVLVLEKNKLMIPTLLHLNKTVWNESAQIYVGDARSWDPPKKVDIIVSELLGSFGDNELSPEILDCTQRYLNEGGIMIPSQSESFIAPIQNHSVYSSINKENLFSNTPNLKGSSYFDKPYVVYSSKSKLINEPKSVFVFDHPNYESNPKYSQYRCLKFTSNSDCVLHAFEGYFSSILADEVKICNFCFVFNLSFFEAIEPNTFTKNLFSWFPMIFPIKIPIPLKKGDEIEFHIWRKNNNLSVWFEWTISKPFPLPIHNTNGSSYKIML